MYIKSCIILCASLQLHMKMIGISLPLCKLAVTGALIGFDLIGQDSSHS